MKYKDKLSKKWLQHGTVALLTLCLIVLILIPALKTLEVSLTESGHFTLQTYSDFFREPNNVAALKKNSIVLGILTVFICGGIGTLLAFLVHYFEMPYKKNLIDKILLIPIVLPGLIIVFAFMQLYGESGIITQSIKLLLKLDDIPYRFTGLIGILYVHAYTQYVYFYLNTSIAIKQIDSSLIEASRNMGASNFQVFKTVIVPFIKPALVTSSIMTFMSGIGSFFSAPSILGGSYRVLTVQILMAKANNFMSIAAMQVILLVATALVFWLFMEGYEKRIQFTPSVRKKTPFQPFPVKRRHLKKILQHGYFYFLCLTILAPVLLIVIVSFVKPGTWMIEIFPKEFSFDNYINIFTKSRVLAPFKTAYIWLLQQGFWHSLSDFPLLPFLQKRTIKLNPSLHFFWSCYLGQCQQVPLPLTLLTRLIHQPGIH